MSLSNWTNWTMDEAAAAAACNEIQTCDECINTHICHFCEKDLQCHTIGSTSGCIIGMSTCHHIEDCVRPQPQHVGYGPPMYVVVGVLCFVATLLCCCCSCSFLYGMIKRVRARSARRRNVKSKQDDDNDATTSLLNEVDSEDASIAAPEPPSPPPRTAFRSIFTRFIWFATFTTITVLALMYYPRMPDYQICNQQFDWESIFQSLISASPKVHYEIITSVINENRFAFDLDYGNAIISHQGVDVGTWSIANWTAEAGAISDMMAQVKIEPKTYSEAYALWSDFRANNLTFKIRTNLSGSIRWGSFKLYAFSVVAPDVDFLVGDKYPRDLCKCTEYLTPVNASRVHL